MAVVAHSSKVLVTGANGFVAVWLVQTLLEQGYSVRGTVRSESKAAFLLNKFRSYSDKFEVVVVEDITKDGAFDEAVKGVDAIEHTASPCHLNVDDPKEIIDPAVNGTVGILKSALKNAPNVKRIVTLASTATILRDSNEPLTFDETDWNTQSPDEVKQHGRNASATAKYRTSKILAERAAWTFYEDHKNQVKWDLTVIHPPFVFGPVAHEVAHPNDLNTSTKEWYNVVIAPNSSGRSKDFLTNGGSCWVDVRDLAAALVKALSVKEAGGERIIISAGQFIWQDWIDIANSLSPSPIPSHAPGTDKALPVGNPDANKTAVYMIKYNTAKEKRILGLEYLTMEETTRDTLVDYERRGW
ncbi:hypothetical protein AMATHDRAFT_70221 [Amanita thiersii Skay4041]|uniref:NAD-dependent epimerase/dehydratase domain-containing protein n=1 Tax=Amanita thiersii Skay4041 TaxID=703135 RepID=A0A2A9NDE1_9AGAR|nr:hypothetical protein AMATHDRAFT_70221 [Amanita thiersii Skay4041]